MSEGSGLKRLSQDENRTKEKSRKSLHSKVYAWSRNDVSTCTCPQLSYRHSHCPCQSCGGKAVSSSTEYNHWERNDLLTKYVFNSIDQGGNHIYIITDIHASPTVLFRTV